MEASSREKEKESGFLGVRGFLRRRVKGESGRGGAGGRAAVTAWRRRD